MLAARVLARADDGLRFDKMTKKGEDRPEIDKNYIFRNGKGVFIKC